MWRRWSGLPIFLPWCWSRISISPSGIRWWHRDRCSRLSWRWELRSSRLHIFYSVLQVESYYMCRYFMYWEGLNFSRESRYLKLFCFIIFYLALSISIEQCWCCKCRLSLRGYAAKQCLLHLYFCNSCSLLVYSYPYTRICFVTHDILLRAASWYDGSLSLWCTSRVASSDNRELVKYVHLTWSYYILVTMSINKPCAAERYTRAKPNTTIYNKTKKYYYTIYHRGPATIPKSV